MQPNAAMHTALPKVPHPGIQEHYTGSRLMARRPTSIMVHVKGHGPRRIYRGDWNNKYFYVLQKSRIEIDVRDVLKLIESV